MSYSELITRQNPSCLLFLIDQSGCMSGSFAGSSMRKDETVAKNINNLIEQIGLECTKGNTVRHYLHL